jgi:hypothetical protein
LKINSPKTKKNPAARGAQKCLGVIYPCHHPEYVFGPIGLFKFHRFFGLGLYLM